MAIIIKQENARKDDGKSGSGRPSTTTMFMCIVDLLYLAAKRSRRSKLSSALRYAPTASATMAAVPCQLERFAQTPVDASALSLDNGCDDGWQRAHPATALTLLSALRALTKLFVQLCQLGLALALRQCRLLALCHADAAQRRSSGIG